MARIKCGICGDSEYVWVGAKKTLCVCQQPSVLQKPDLVNIDPETTHYYDLGGISTLAFIEAKELGYHAGNIIKYVSRHQHKGTPLRDLEKAATYLNRLIERAKSNEST